MTVTVLSKDNCIQCAATERALKQNGIDYVKRNVVEDAEAYALATSLGYMQAPVVIAGDESWSGFRPDRIAALAS